MSLSKKVAALVLLAAVPSLAQSTQHLDREIEINVEPSSNLEVVLEHQGILDQNNDPVTVFDDELQGLEEKNMNDGYSLAIEEEEGQHFGCDCHLNQNNEDHNDYNDDADYDEIFVETEEEGQHEKADENENQECDCHDDDNQNDGADDDYDADYGQVFVESHVEENKRDEDQQVFLPDQDNLDENENFECDCHLNQNNEDQDEYDADYGVVVVESQVEEEEQDKRDEDQQVFLPDQDNLDENENFGCDCHLNQNNEDQDEYDADYGQMVVESEGDDMKDEQVQVDKKQSNLRTSAISANDQNVDEGEEVAILVTYDQIMATLSEEEKEAEAATGEPFYKRMVDLILGKETQKELEAAHILSGDADERRGRNYYDGL